MKIFRYNPSCRQKPTLFSERWFFQYFIWFWAFSSSLLAFWHLVSHVFITMFILTTCFSTAGLRRTGKSRHFVFWLYFAPFIIIFVAIIVMDLLSSGFYIYDYFSSLSVNGLIRILEIRNSDEIRPILERISISTRSLPAIIMFGITSNAILILIFNVFLVFVFSPAAWQVCAANQNIVKVLRKMEHKKSSRARSLKRPKSPTIPTVSRRTHQVNLTVSPVQQYPKNQNEEQIQNDQQKPSIETQPPFNPYMNSQQKQETHF